MQSGPLGRVGAVQARSKHVVLSETGQFDSLRNALGSSPVVRRSGFGLLAEDGVDGAGRSINVLLKRDSVDGTFHFRGHSFQRPCTILASF